MNVMAKASEMKVGDMKETLSGFKFLTPEETKHSMTKGNCLLYTSPSPRDGLLSRMPSSA